MLLTVCFEAGRFTLTQSSWTVLQYCSRKWMSGQAAALVQPSNRLQFDVIVTSASALRDSTWLSAGGTPFPLDFYLSWMDVPGFSAITSPAGAAFRTGSTAPR